MPLPKRDKYKFFEQILRHEVRSRIEEFRQYTLEIESKFNSDKNSLSNSYSEAIKGLSNDEIREVEDYFSDDYYLIEEIHIGLYRKSTLVSVYSFLENSMNSLCLHLQRSHSYPVELNDLRGEGIVRAKIYLEKLAGIDFTLINGEWSELIAFNKLRNCIVHSEGNIKASKNSTQLENIINQKSSLSLRHERHLKVEREYIDAIMTTTEAFLEKLHQQAIPA
ncbi:hypothetical protein I6M53_14935 [Shewanella algae]|uniref:hypothetical protein n=1 Tax=Shewanella algae TaxID=38313 RepID=UPI001AAD9950|nr:hypothetical protein [Shewanella algae]MBO2675934.1 hypothetical protein [Shewanella algae]